jgi:hypothetical protein
MARAVESSLTSDKINNQGISKRQKKWADCEYAKLSSQRISFALGCRLRNTSPFNLSEPFSVLKRLP